MIGHQAHNIIEEASAKIAAISIIPVPLIDFAAMTYFQYEMVKELAEIHDIEIEENTNLIISSVLSSLISKLVSTGVEKLASRSRLDKMLQESMIRATISGFIVTIIGEVYEMHFKNGGNLGNINLRTFVNYFEKQFKSKRWTFSELSKDFLHAIDQQFRPKK